MKIICVQKTRFALWRLLRQMRRLVPGAAVHGCRSPNEAIDLAKREGCDVLLTDTNLAGAHTDGIMLATRIKAINPRVNIIFITDHENNAEATAAFRLHASGYIVKPYKLERLAVEFSNLRYTTV